MSAIPLDVMLWISGGIWGLGVLALIPIWWRGRERRAGRVVGFNDQDVTDRNIALGLLTLGTMTAIGTALTIASQAMSFGSFVMLGGAWIALMLIIALVVDGRRARHR
ncbi:hypothetical protein D3273_22865 [Lichenibacterium minor]|uniref:Uncharacterized protein n=1 Tax=Lichenibacterium minor TaxID=2316528 RepID=A0A4Q2U4E2_9HYPH|nr:hypothetical protein [Lichenibacterium minor]RYC29656.1 hypothetical protein D3273_22865 [Lichenibacterium minor]